MEAPAAIKTAAAPTSLPTRGKLVVGVVGRQVHHHLQGGVEELCHPHQADGADDHSPFQGGEAQPERQCHHHHADQGMDPGVLLGADDVPPAGKGVTERVAARDDETADFVHRGL